MPNIFDDPAAPPKGNIFDAPSHQMGRNIFDDAVAGAQRGAGDLAHRTHADAAASAGGALLSRLGVPRVIDLLDRQRQATQAAIARGPGAGAQTLVHGADGDAQNANRAAVRQRLGMDNDYHDDRLFGVIPQPRSLANFERGLIDFATDTVTDPVSYETFGLSTAARGVGDLAKGAIDASGIVKTPVGKRAAMYRNLVTDPLTYGGSAKRELGTPRYDAALAADNRQAAKEPEAARRLGARFDAAISGLTDDEKRNVYRVLNGEEQLTDPATGKLIVKPHVAEAFAQLDRLRKDMAAMQANPSGMRRLGYNLAPLANAKYAARVEPWTLSYAKRGSPNLTRSNLDAVMAMQHSDDAQKGAGGAHRLVGRIDRPYALPEDLQDFAAPVDQGILGALNLRRHYLPGPHAAAAIAPDAPERTFNLLRPRAPNLMQRDEFSIAGDDDLSKYDQAFRGAIAQAARQATGGRLRDEVGVPLSFHELADQAMEKLFERTTAARGANRTAGQIAGEDWKNIVNIPKNTVTTLGMKHGLINVPTLAALSEGPGTALDALLGGARLARKGPADRYAALQDAIEGGVIAPFEERANPIVDTLAKLPTVFSKVPGKPGQVLRSVAGAPAAVSRGANDLTWAIDDAAKQAVYRRKMMRTAGQNQDALASMTEAQREAFFRQSADAAAAQTMREMIDYRHKSDATRALGAVAPFATFRSRLPAAVASAAARHPERVLAFDRATQGLSSNGAVDVNGHRVSVTTPLSDALELGTEPQKYVRSTLADPVRALLSPIGLPSLRRDPYTGEETWKMQPSYMTYGDPLLPHYDERSGKWKAGFIGSQLASYAPLSIGEAALQMAGGSEFPPEDILSELLGGTLGVRVR